MRIVLPALATRSSNAGASQAVRNSRLKDPSTNPSPPPQKLLSRKVTPQDETPLFNDSTPDSIREARIHARSQVKQEWFPRKSPYVRPEGRKVSPGVSRHAPPPETVSLSDPSTSSVAGTSQPRRLLRMKPNFRVQSGSDPGVEKISSEPEDRPSVGQGSTGKRSGASSLAGLPRRGYSTSTLEGYHHYSTEELVDVLKSHAKDRMDRRGLRDLIRFAERHHRSASTASYNVLLGIAAQQRNVVLFRRLLDKMKAHGHRRNASTWDTKMTLEAHNSKWDLVVDDFEQRKHDGVPLTRVGWTRIAQAATRSGTSSLSEKAISSSMSPIYSAVYTLPKGVRQARLRDFLTDVKLDIDMLLAHMMPDNMRPLDYKSTVVIAHRLAKQRRSREAEDIVFDWLDRAEVYTERSKAMADDPETAGESESEAVDMDSFMKVVSARSTALLHVLLEGLVVNRSSTEEVRAYVDNYVERWGNLAPRPSYHTLVFVLAAYRILPFRTQFQEISRAFAEFEETYGLVTESAYDRYGQMRCHQALAQSAAWVTKASVKHHTFDDGWRQEVQTRLDSIVPPGLTKRLKQGGISTSNASFLKDVRYLEQKLQKTMGKGKSIRTSEDEGETEQSPYEAGNVEAEIDQVFLEPESHSPLKLQSHAKSAQPAVLPVDNHDDGATVMPAAQGQSARSKMSSCGT